MSAQLLLLGALLGILALAVSVSLVRIHLDAYHWRQLVKAAGGKESRARCYIEQASLDTLLDKREAQKFVRRLPRNVVRFVPRVVSGGRPVRFEPTDGAA